MKALLQNRYLYIFCLFFFFTLAQFEITVSASEPQQTSTVVSADITTQTDSHESKKEESHGGMEPLFFIVVALLLGAAAKHFLKKSPVPYTVLLLLIGLALGATSKLNLFAGNFHTMDVALNWAGNFDPQLILFVFLPTLIFEAAFALDVHVFKKSVVNATIFAVPGLLVSMVITAAFAIACGYFNIGLEGWSWAFALMFGAVVSATDPVAVVSLLKELGVSKKLGTLIDGESLLNDGTSIVVFMVFFLGFTGAASGNNAIVEFIRVAIGGVAVGVIIGWIAIKWLKNVYNNAMVEISIIIAVAYLTFFTAEHFFHVSGVMALVAYGLYMAGSGKTKISPEVTGFLHEFWELAAFIANTLIFIIVGVVVAHQAVFTAGDFVTLIIIYIGIHVARGVMILLFFPVVRKIGYGLTGKQAVVVWFGGLRGAIALALALVVMGVDDKYIPLEIRNQFMFLTAGLVVLTLLINATTIKFVIKKLGLSDVAAEKIQLFQNAQKYLQENALSLVERLKKNKHIAQADWSLVKKYIPAVAEIKNESIQSNTIAEIRRRLLEKEKSSYWSQFNEGMLGAVAVKNLTDSVSQKLDEEGRISLSLRKNMEDILHMPKYLLRLNNISWLAWFAQKAFNNRLMLGFDCARGFIEAQEEVTVLFEEIKKTMTGEENEKIIEILDSEINENKILRGTFMRNLKKIFPDIYKALSTQHAIRSLLNHEKKMIEKLLHDGRIETDEAEEMITKVDEKIKKIMAMPLGKVVG